MGHRSQDQNQDSNLPINSLAKTLEHLLAVSPINSLAKTLDLLLMVWTINSLAKTLEHLFSVWPINCLTKTLEHLWQCSYQQTVSSVASVPRIATPLHRCQGHVLELHTPLNPALEEGKESTVTHSP
ncbi:hypothetical protein BsWGS_15320 [Bradybaena similaris]